MSNATARSRPVWPLEADTRVEPVLGLELDGSEAFVCRPLLVQGLVCLAFEHNEGRQHGVGEHLDHQHHRAALFAVALDDLAHSLRSHWRNAVGVFAVELHEGLVGLMTTSHSSDSGRGLVKPPTRWRGCQSSVGLSGTHTLHPDRPTVPIQHVREEVGSVVCRVLVVGVEVGEIDVVRLVGWVLPALVLDHDLQVDWTARDRVSTIPPLQEQKGDELVDQRVLSSHVMLPVVLVLLFVVMMLLLARALLEAPDPT